MKKIIMFVIIAVLLVAGCQKKQDTITFTATIEEIFDTGISVVTTEDVSFDKATVYFSDKIKVDFPLEVGQVVSLTIYSEIRESYPVQVTATAIKLIEEKAEGKVEKVEYKKISGEDAAQMMGEDVIVLDARTKEEFESGHIANALLLPYDEITSETAQAVLPDKDKTILVYCKTGRRSEIAAKALIELGYTAVYDFGGITTDWKGEVVK